MDAYLVLGSRATCQLNENFKEKIGQIIDAEIAKEKDK